MTDHLVFVLGPRDGGLWPWAPGTPDVFRVPVAVSAGYWLESPELTESVDGLFGEYRRTREHDGEGRLIYRWYPAGKAEPGA